MSSLLSLALVAGMVAALNPCAFALLPAYVSALAGAEPTQSAGLRRVVQPIATAAAMSLGFLAVFITLGAAVSIVTDGVRARMPWITVVVGAAVLVAGVATLFGRSVPGLRRPLAWSSRRGLLGQLVYGVVYASASLSCTLGPFLAITTAATSRSLLDGIAAYAAYAVGMSVVVAMVALAVTVRQGRSRPLRRSSRLSSRAGGVLMVLSGAYAIWYGRWELGVFSGDLRRSRIIEEVDALRVGLITRMEAIGVARLALLVLVLVAVGLIADGRRSASQRPPESPPAAQAAARTAQEDRS